MKNRLPNIAIHGSHNAAFCVEHGGKILEIVELERFLNKKNVGYQLWEKPNCQNEVSDLVLNYFKRKYGFTQYDKCLYQHCEDFLHQIPANEFIEGKHHESHAAGCFYQSPYEDAIAISFDGGGNDGYFRTFVANRITGLTPLKDFDINLGGCYFWMGHVLDDIEFTFGHAPLVYSGKILGLQSYGTINQNWLVHFKEYYRENNKVPWNSYERTDLFNKIGMSHITTNAGGIRPRLSGQVAYDIAATSQYAFECVFFELIDDLINSHPGLPICVAGGCGLNITLNTKIKERYNRPTFVGPNPSDCGLTVGMLAGLIKPQIPIDVTYLGSEVLDRNQIQLYVENYNGIQTTPSQVAREIFDGKIVGVVQGRAEHGPRALGNRSIICNPLISDMKDKLNAKVKNREWYRPFAPVVRLEDVSEYFAWEEESRWMNFCVDVQDAYKTLIPSVVHVDGSARIQTVTREQNEFIYDLLTEFKEISGIGVLLNTSFNVAGSPILSSYGEAFRVLHETELDSLYLDGYYFMG